MMSLIEIVYNYILVLSFLAFQTLLMLGSMNKASQPNSVIHDIVGLQVFYLVIVCVIN